MNSTATFLKYGPEISQINPDMEDLRKSQVWRNSRLLICDIYTVTKNFPDRDDPQFKNLTRRLAVLIPGNIVRSLQEKNPNLRRQFLNNAESCMNKLNSLMQVAHKKGYIQTSLNQNLLFRRSLKQSDSRQNSKA
jgi:four helix bundle protein